MKTWLAVGAALLAAAGAAQAQDGRDRAAEQLRREHAEARKKLDERFRAKMQRIDQEFQRRAEALKKGGRAEAPKRAPAVDPAIQRLARAIEELRRDLESLKKRLADRPKGKQRRPPPRRKPL